MQVSWCSLLTHLKSLLLEFPTVMKAISLHASVPRKNRVCFCSANFIHAWLGFCQLTAKKGRICIIVYAWYILLNRCCVCICACVKRPIRLCLWWSHGIKLERFVDWGQDIVWEEWMAHLVLHLHNDWLSIGWWVEFSSRGFLCEHNWGIERLFWEVIHSFQPTM